MIHKTTLGLLCMLFMMLGMKEPNAQTCCSLNCSTSCLMMFLQPAPDDRSPVGENNRIRRHGKLGFDRMRPNGDGKNRQTTAITVEHIMEFAQEIYPELAAQLSNMCEKDPEAFDKIVRRQWPRLGILVRLREDNPELFEVKVTEFKTDAEIYHVAELLRGQDVEDPSTKAKIAELKGLVRVKTAISLRAQSLYIERQERQLERQERQLAALRARLEDTSLRFDEIVDARLNQLLQAVGDEKAKQHSQTD